MRRRMENYIKEEVETLKTLKNKKLTEDQFTKRMKDAVERNFENKEKISKGELNARHWSELRNYFDYVVKREFELYRESCQA